MASLYGPQYARIWADAIQLPGTADLWQSAVQEAASYLDIPLETAEATLTEAWDGRIAAQRERFSSVPAHEYYRQDPDSILRGLVWHTLTRDTFALVAVAALHAAQRFADGTTALEFGHGIGSAGLLFAANGFDVTLYDVGEDYQDFAKWRFERRDVAARFILGPEALEGTGPYDLAYSLDVMEHIPDPLAEVRRIHGLLKPGGVLVMSVAFGLDPDTPEHLLRGRRGFVDRVRRIGFERATPGDPLVFFKTATPRSSTLSRIGDTTSAAWTDAEFAPGVGGLVHRMRVHLPPDVMPPTTWPPA